MKWAFGPVLLVLLLSQFVTSQTYASEPEHCEPDCVPIGEWSFRVGIGFGARSNPVLGQDDVPIYLVPEVSYYGEKFFLENLDFGYTLINSERSQLNLLLLTPGFEHIFFDDDIFARTTIEGRTFSFGDTSGSLRTESAPMGSLSTPVDELPQGVQVADPIPDKGVDTSDPNRVMGGDPTAMPGNPLVPGNESTPAEVQYLETEISERRMAGMSGFEYIWFHDRFELQLQVLDDVSGVHHGEKIRAALSFPFRANKSEFLLTTGLTYQSAQLLNYYYGVNEGDFNYQPGSGITKYLRADWRYKLSEKWSLRAVVNFKQLDDAVVDSPIVVDDQSTTYFFGGVYHF